MKLFEFEKHFPDESACKMKFKEMRDKEGITCSKCGSKEHVWLNGHGQYQCKKCRHRTTLRSGTVMHGSKLPFAIGLLPCTFSRLPSTLFQRLNCNDS